MCSSDLHDVSYKILDRGIIEIMGPTGISALINNLTRWISSLQSGFVYNYAFTIFLGTTVFLIILTNLDYCLIQSELLGILPVFALLIFI